MLIRFTVLGIDADSGYKSGILVAAHTLRDEGDLTVAEHNELRLAIKWFNEHLPHPKVLHNTEHRRAISWFKPAATQFIQKMWQLKELLDQHDHYVEVLRTTDPGIIVYEDEVQVIAKPRKGQRLAR